MFTKRQRRSVNIVRAKGCPFETQDRLLPSVCQSIAGRTGNVLCPPPGSWPRSPKRLVRVSPDTHNLHPPLSVTRLAWLIPVFSPQTNTRKKTLLPTMQDRQSDCGCAHPPRVAPAGGSRTSTAANALRLFKPATAHNKW